MIRSFRVTPLVSPGKRKKKTEKRRKIGVAREKDAERHVAGGMSATALAALALSVRDSAPDARLT